MEVKKEVADYSTTAMPGLYPPGPLSGEQIEAFYGTGFIVIDGLFSADEVAAMRDAFDRLAATALRFDRTVMHRGSQFVMDAETADVRIKRIVWCGAAEPVLSELGGDPRLIEIAAQILGSDTVEQLINQAHFKFPGDGVRFAWHQDSVHRRYGTPLWQDLNGRGSFVEIATGVDAMTAENGPLNFIAGTGDAGHIEPDPETGDLPDGSFDVTAAVALALEPGSAVVFGPYVVHGSEPNRSVNPRRLFLNGFACPGANKRVYPGDGAGRQLRIPR